MRGVLPSVSSIAYATTTSSFRLLPAASFYHHHLLRRRRMTTMGSSASSSSSSNSFDLAPSALSKIEKFASVNGDVLFGYVEQYLIANSTNNNDEIDKNGDSPYPPAVVSFGDFLDAGTGSHSLRWMASIIHRDRLLFAATQQSNNGQQSSSTTTAAAAPRVTMKSYTAITADESMRRRVHNEQPN